MYNNTYDRAECIILGYRISLEKLLTSLVFVIGNNLHLTLNKENHFLCTRVNNLHNLNTDPKKALKIVCLIKRILDDCKTNGKTNENKEFYLEMINHHVKNEFLGDPAAVLFIEYVLEELSLLIDDDNQFSPFTYF